MESLQAFFAENRADIHTLARYIQRYVDEHWETVFQNTRSEMLERYDEIGDSVYGIYGARLFKPIHDQLKAVGLRATPRLPGSLMISREWGEEADRQRWMWSKIVSADGVAVGTIVVVFFHDHLQIRVPRAFRVIGLEATSKGAVIEALSQLAPEFRDALEMKAEIALYMQQYGSSSEQ